MKPSTSDTPLQQLNPLPHLELRALLRLVEQGFEFESAQSMATEFIIDQRIDVHCLHVAKHPKGWVILADFELIPGSCCQFREDAIARGRSDAQALECALCIHSSDGSIEERISPFRNY